MTTNCASMNYLHTVKNKRLFDWIWLPQFPVQVPLSCGAGWLLQPTANPINFNLQLVHIGSTWMVP